MYRKFEIKVGNSFLEKEYSTYLSNGQTIFADSKDIVGKTLSRYILSNGSIDGNMMKEDWFKTKRYDVFLSHSHKDIETVKAFAGWLNNTFGLTCFIDSCVWGYCDDLLKKIDNKYCLNESGEAYSYERRNYSTAHVHMMLSTALTEVMNLSECLMFFNTPNSVSLVEDFECIKNGKNIYDNIKVSLSPWIYHELSMSKYLKQTEPERPKTAKMAVFEHSETHKQEMNIQYDITAFLAELTELNDEDLIKWKKQYKLDYTEHPLDILYMLSAMNEKISGEVYGKKCIF